MQKTFAVPFGAWIKILLKFMAGALVPGFGFQKEIIHGSSRFMKKEEHTTRNNQTASSGL